MNAKSRGFSLVELMMALVAGLIVSYAVLAFTMSSMKNNGEYVQSTQLTQELRNTLDLATRELKRAGYDENALSHMAAGDASPFSPMLISGANTDSSCLIYGYDRIAGNPGVVDINRGEVRGLRRVVVNGVGIVEFAVSIGSTRPACADDSSTNYASYPPVCSSTGWCPLSDSKRVNVTAFRVAPTIQTTGTGTAQVRLREFKITLSGRRVGDTGTNYLNNTDSSSTRTVVSTVKVRSECARNIITQCDVSP
jgi:prepilin-type N-terminal cleavage/methylation domain-containing protein